MSEADSKNSRGASSASAVAATASVKSSLARPPATDAPAVCDRCGAEMYRMHAVWRCPTCGFKTDCCGW